ncbi:hypothetical protein ACQPZ2_36975 [Nocardia pseudovaccinii]|uniref:hypothetical protein n=1 Tax=Nocardia pseudovaccinii TaxID=189540 RepID=UPI003D8ADCB1
MKPLIDVVNVLDVITLAADHVDSWLQRWHTDYLPDAHEQRGMRVVRVWRSYPSPDTVSIHILWELDGGYAFYGMRSAAGADPGVDRFWVETDAIAITRDRRMLQPLEAN